MRPKLRLICPNHNCINKSIVYRNPNTISNWDCKRCGTRLVNFKSPRDVNSDKKAKEDLKQFNV